MDKTLRLQRKLLFCAFAANPTTLAHGARCRLARLTNATISLCNTLTPGVLAKPSVAPDSLLRSIAQEASKAIELIGINVIYSR